MQKTFIFGLLIITALTLSGCSLYQDVQKSADVLNPAAQAPAGNAILQKSKSNINGAVNQENAHLNEALGADGSTPASTSTSNSSNTTPMNLAQQYNSAILHTSLGDITIEFYLNDAPKTVENFLKLASEKFYDNVIFHRVIKGFMIQGGDPTGTGTGGPGYQFADEINPASTLYQTGYKRGIVAMANAGKNTNGSQFFIMHQDYALPPSYTIFGHVTKGIETVDAIATTPTASGDRPVKDVVIKSVEFVKK